MGGEMLNLKRILKIIESNSLKVDAIKEAKRYYNNANDILETGVTSTAVDGVKDNIMRNADNRIPHRFHGLLVDEKTAYMFTYPPIIDIDDNQGINDKVNVVLGDNFQRKLKVLCVEASNCGLAWLHYWVSVNGEFKFEKVNSEECIPIYDNTLEHNLTEMIRTYQVMEYENEESDNAKPYNMIEYWTESEFYLFKFKQGSNQPILNQRIKHNFGTIPFIKFSNNSHETSDLSKYKKQIDLYDKVMSGYANDIEDVQQIIYILENYGGEDTEGFMQNLKRYKTIEVENNEISPKGDFRTLQIDIPVEARQLILDVLKKQIYEFGQGLQQDVESVGNASGVALKFFYRKLELKAGATEIEFRDGINKLVEAILKFLNISFEKIQQTYTRNMIGNDMENAQIAQQSVGVIPLKYILQNHPWVDDPEEAMKIIEEDKVKSEMELEDAYPIKEGEVDGE